MIRTDKFTEKAQKALTASQELVKQYKHSQWDVEHILLALLQQDIGVTIEIFNELGIETDPVKKKLETHLTSIPTIAKDSDTFYPTPRVDNLLRAALVEAGRFWDEYVGVDHLLLAISSEQDGKGASILKECGVTQEKTQGALQNIRGGQRVTDPRAESKYRILGKYARDLTLLAKEGKLDPVIGRENEMQRVMQVLTRRSKNNPIIIGEAGVGKTSIVEGIAQKIVQDDVPDFLGGKKIVTLDSAVLVAGSKFRGEFEERLKAVVNTITYTSNTVLLIEGLHIIVGLITAEGGIDTPAFLKPFFEEGVLQCIGTTTPRHYRDSIQTDDILNRWFWPIYIDEPPIEETIELLHSIKYRYERHYGLAISDQALTAAAFLSAYIPDRVMPDKAIDLIDDASAMVRIRESAKMIDLMGNRPVVTEDDVSYVVNMWTDANIEQPSKSKPVSEAPKADKPEPKPEPKVEVQHTTATGNTSHLTKPQ